MRRLHALLGSLLLVSCGGGGAGGPSSDAAVTDGSPTDSDAGPDATTDATPDADPGMPVRVEARSFEGPLAGVTVAFLDAADATVAMATTDAAGVALGAVPSGGSVVAVSPARDRAYLWRAVAAGDVLHARYDETAPVHAVTFALPFAGSSGSYRITTRCGKSGFSSSRDVTVMLPVACTTSGLIAQFFNLAGWRAFHVPAQALTAATVDLTANVFAPTVSYTVSASGITANSATMSNEVRIGEVVATGMFKSVSGMSPVGMMTFSGDAMNVTGAEVITLLETKPGSANQQLIRRGPIPPAPPDFNAADRLVDVFSPAYSAATRTMSWGKGTIGQPLETVRGTLVFTRPGLPDLTWELVAPVTTSVRLPPLPAALSAADPGTTAAATRRIRGYALPGGYDRARSVMFAGPDPDALLAQPGLLRISDSLIP